MREGIVIMGMATIFISVLFTLFVVSTFMGNFNLCVGGPETPVCGDSDFLFILFFSYFSFIILFLVIDGIVIYFVLSVMRMGKPAKAGTAASLRREIRGLEMDRANIRKMKKEAEKRYYKGHINEETFNSMLQGYEREIISINVRIRDLRKGLRPRGR